MDHLPESVTDSLTDHLTVVYDFEFSSVPLKGGSPSLFRIGWMICVFSNNSSMLVNWMRHGLGCPILCEPATPDVALLRSAEWQPAPRKHRKDLEADNIANLLV